MYRPAAATTTGDDADLPPRQDAIELQFRRELQQRHGCAVLLKGGHLQGDAAPDVLVEGPEVRWLENRRIHGVHTHGTGCTLSAAIATGLALGAMHYLRCIHRAQA